MAKTNYREQNNKRKERQRKENTIKTKANNPEQ